MRCTYLTIYEWKDSKKIAENSLDTGKSCSSLEVFPIDDGDAGLVVLLLGDPLELEGWEGGQGGAADPCGVLTLWWSDDLDRRVVGDAVGDLVLHAVSIARDGGGTIFLPTQAFVPP